MGVGRNGLVAALDVGSTKVSCFIARLDARGAVRVGGIGHHEAKGIRGGAVIDVDAAERSIRAAVDAAERMAGQTVDRVLVSFAGGHPASHTVGIEVGVPNRPVADGDVARVFAEARAHIDPGEREMIHNLPVDFSLDGTHGIREPRGMFGSRLGINLHIVTAAGGITRNVALAIERGHLAVERFVVAPYAAGLACLVPEELDLGATIVDMGGGTTSFGVFRAGQFVHVDSVPIGGAHVTLDIARVLATPVNEAERMKTLYGSALPSPADEREMMDVPQIGEDKSAANQIPRSTLNGIVRLRVEETLELVRDRLEKSGPARHEGRRVVLTGGASQLSGVRELAARVLDRPVRLGRPAHLNGLADATGGPAFAACAGLLVFASHNGSSEAVEAANENNGRFARIGRWLKGNF